MKRRRDPSTVLQEKRARRRRLANYEAQFLARFHRLSMANRARWERCVTHTLDANKLARVLHPMVEKAVGPYVHKKIQVVLSVRSCCDASPRTYRVNLHDHNGFNTFGLAVMHREREAMVARNAQDSPELWVWGWAYRLDYPLHTQTLGFSDTLLSLLQDIGVNPIADLENLIAGYQHTIKVRRYRLDPLQHAIMEWPPQGECAVGGSECHSAVAARSAQTRAADKH
jgi:hypothetical protein